MISVYKDTNTINSKGKDNFVNQIELLAEKYPDNLIIEKTDTLDTELLQNQIHNAERLKKSDNYIESYGPFVLGHSRLNHSVLGNNNDDKELVEILEIIFGAKSRNQYIKQEIRDAMHILTAERHGGKYFITTDKKLLKSSDKIFARFSSIIICTPENCLIKIMDKFKVLGLI